MYKFEKTIAAQLLVSFLLWIDIPLCLCPLCAPAISQMTDFAKRGPVCVSSLFQQEIFFPSFSVSSSCLKSWLFCTSLIVKNVLAQFFAAPSCSSRFMTGLQSGCVFATLSVQTNDLLLILSSLKQCGWQQCLLLLLLVTKWQVVLWTKLAYHDINGTGLARDGFYKCATDKPSMWLTVNRRDKGLLSSPDLSHLIFQWLRQSIASVISYYREFLNIKISQCKYFHLFGNAFINSDALTINWDESSFVIAADDALTAIVNNNNNLR